MHADAWEAVLMRIIRGLHNLRPAHRGCVATIGNFDGVHLGHQAVFEALKAKGRELGLPATVITFEPHPQEYFAPAAATARLTRLREKLQALREADIAQVLLLEFGAALAAMTAEAFVRRVLVEGLGVRYLYVGDDFRFGQGRAGDIGLLRRAGAEQGFEVASMATYAVGGERVSSTRVREALARADLETARQCLGRPYRICGRVVHGDKRGRQLGFPTANIGLHRKASPLHGVYAVRIHGLVEGAWPAVANLGNRPTVGGERRYLLEVHLFDFERTLYGAHLEVEFCRRLREERRFDSVEQLRQQIARDASEARAFFGLAVE